MWTLLISLHLITVPSAAEAMNFIKEDITPVLEFSIDWAMKAALAATSTHAFIVLCKRIP